MRKLKTMEQVMAEGIRVEVQHDYEEVARGWMAGRRESIDAWDGPTEFEALVALIEAVYKWGRQEGARR